MAKKIPEIFTGGEKSVYQDNNIVTEWYIETSEA